jgi:hypothetical protein
MPTIRFSAPQRRNKPLKPESFMLIAGDLAAEQRAIVAHSASYGSDRPHISQAPTGATENHGSSSHFFRPIRGLNCFLSIPTVVTVGYYRLLLRSFIFKNHRSSNSRCGLLSHAISWLAQIHWLRSFDLWPTPSPIC